MFPEMGHTERLEIGLAQGCLGIDARHRCAQIVLAVNVAQAPIEAEGGPDILKGVVDVLIAEAFAMAVLGVEFAFGLRHTGTAAESF